MVCPDFKLVLGAFDKVSPLLQGLDDGEHLLVMDLVVVFHQGQGFGEEGDWVPLSIFGRDLREDSSSCKVGTVRFNAERLGGVQGDEDGGRCDILLELIESRLLVCSPMPFHVVLSKVEERPGVFREVLDEAPVVSGHTISVTRPPTIRMEARGKKD